MKHEIIAIKGNTKTRLSTDFVPYDNLISDWNEDMGPWAAGGLEEAFIVTSKPVVIEKRESFQVLTHPEGHNGHVELERAFLGEPDTDYYFSVSIRNEGALTSRVTVNGQMLANTDRYANQLSFKVKSDMNGDVKVRIEFHHTVPNGSNVWVSGWVGGFMAVEVPEDLSGHTTQELENIFKFTESKVTSPSVRRFLENRFDLPADAYFVVVDGVGVNSLEDTLEDIGYVDGQVFEVYEHDLGTQISETFLNDIKMMSMLEGDPMHLSYMYPEEVRDMSYEAAANFPRLQFYTGFEVNSLISDGKPFASSINYAIRFYLPTTKVLESLTAQMLMDRMNAVMRELKWAPIRGSDMFIKQPKIFSLEVQYIKDVKMANK